MANGSGDAVLRSVRSHRTLVVAVALFAAIATVPLVLSAPTVARASTDSATIAVTPVTQQHALDCEAAALQMALSAVGINVSQATLLAQFGTDLRAPVMRNGAPAQWGDPYQTFVGNVDGNFVITGYGVYYPPIVKAASDNGASAEGGEGWQPAQLYKAVAAGHPVVVRVPHLLAPASVGYWTAWDGRQVWYSHRDHAQTLVGFDYGSSTVTLADPADGQLHTYAMAAFENAFALFHAQAIVVSPGGAAVTQAVSPTTGSINIAVRGPDNSLRLYWSSDGGWYGPVGLEGPGAAFSGPAVVAEGNGNFDVAVEGPSNTLDLYWYISDRWYGPGQVGPPGSTYSTPSMTIDPNGHITIAVQGPSHSLYVFWNAASKWYGPGGLGAANSTFGAPALALVGSAPQTLEAVVQSGDAALQQYSEHSGGSWSGPNAWSQVDQQYSAAASTPAVTLYQGPGNSLDAHSASGTTRVGAPGTTFSAPAVASFGTVTYAASQGFGHRLDFYIDNGGWGGATIPGSNASSYSAPSVVVEAGGNVDLAVEGPSNTLYLFWRIGSRWYGPGQIGTVGSVFAALP
ncbi:MAG: C39 family peptidase [Candidatus Dormibacteraeota bacterium]|nr:C39 family peptidase [Candidatus Dormibacteraeota bacterium]